MGDALQDEYVEKYKHLQYLEVRLDQTQSVQKDISIGVYAKIQWLHLDIQSLCVSSVSYLNSVIPGTCPPFIGEGGRTLATVHTSFDFFALS